MKVFTVGLDQKPPGGVEKSESPPPGYVSSTPTPIPMGPELTPIVVRKSRGYKGILLVMLAVFLMAIFALTLSEMAYNRQRDENFFRLQWAQLKHRFGYGRHPNNGFDSSPYGPRIIPVNGRDGGDDAESSPLAEIAALSRQQQQQQARKNGGDIDARVDAPWPSSRIGGGAGGDESASSASASSQEMRGAGADRDVSSASSASSQEMRGGAGGADERDAMMMGGAGADTSEAAFMRDARLQFLRQILQRIRANAEEMGFDGTMQVSVIEVEPQNIGDFMSGGAGAKKPASPAEDPRSDAFLDSFGEFHAPPPFGAAGGPPPMREIAENSIVAPSGEHEHQAQSARDSHPPPPPPPMTPEFSAFEIPMPPFPGGQPQAPQMSMQPMISMRPDIASLMMSGFRAPSAGHEWSFQPARPEMIMDEAQWRQAFAGNGVEMPPPPPPPPKMPGSSAEFPGANAQMSPSQELMGEIYGRKFGRMLQDLIAARIQNSLMMQQQQQQQQAAAQAASQPSQMMMPNLIMPMRPSFPIEPMPAGAQSPTSWWQEPAGQQQQPSASTQGQASAMAGQFQPPPPPPPPALPAASAGEPQPSEPVNQAAQAGNPVQQQQASGGAQQEQPEQQRSDSQQQQQQANQQQQQMADQFGANFPQPQFPVFVSPEDRIQIEPPNAAAMWQPAPQQQQQQVPAATPNDEEKTQQQQPSQIPHAILDFMPPPRAWTHQSEVIDFPAVKFPQMGGVVGASSSADSSQPLMMNDPSIGSENGPAAQNSGIFFQVDEPQQNSGAAQHQAQDPAAVPPQQQSMAGFI